VLGSNDNPQNIHLTKFYALPFPLTLTIMVSGLLLVHDNRKNILVIIALV